MARENVRRQLQVILNDEEKAKYARELARVTSEETTLMDHKKEIVAEFAAKIKRCAAYRNELAIKIGTGREMRDVECRWRTDWEENAHYLERIDTGEEVERVPVTPDERQQNLFDQRNQEQEAEPDEPEASVAAVQEAFSCQEAVDLVCSEIGPEPEIIPPATVDELQPLCVMDVGAAIPCVGCGNCEVADIAGPDIALEMPVEEIPAEEEAPAEPLIDEEPEKKPEAAPTGPVKFGVHDLICPICGFGKGLAQTHVAVVRHLRRTHNMIVKNGLVVPFECQMCKSRKHRKLCGPDCTWSDKK